MLTVSLLNGLGACCCSHVLANSASISRAIATQRACAYEPNASTNLKKSTKSTVPLPSRSKRGSVPP